jgi:hypothetical protein
MRAEVQAVGARQYLCNSAQERCPAFFLLLGGLQIDRDDGIQIGNASPIGCLKAPVGRALEGRQRSLHSPSLHSFTLCVQLCNMHMVWCGVLGALSTAPDGASHVQAL